MTQRPSAGARVGEAGVARTTPPELPRTTVDTRMPPAPARGGRIITVGAPSGRVRKGELDGGVALVVLAIAAVVTIVWRAARRASVRQPLL
jgi:hypothetical protein